VRLIDARAPERFRGEAEPIDPAAGHIPTAINLPTAGNLGPGDRFRSSQELADLYERSYSPTVVYCGSGVSACHTALAMELAGLPRPMLYPGSWSDWSTSGGAVETG
jgi:thiosulfate/3-mercaptopyruvate sulfurtransferase